MPVNRVAPAIKEHRWAICLLPVLLWWRFYQIGELALPAWVDSVHHALLVRILLEQGWLPTTWGPYLPETPFYYHFGFHVTAAIWAWATGQSGADLGRAVLMVGQFWQVALALAIYILGHTMWHSRAKALAVMLLVGFVSTMPAYYATWGRYTLLAGLTLMILAMSAALAGRKILLALLIVGTAVTHHYALFLLAIYLLIVWLVIPVRRHAVVAGGLLGLLLAAPWLWRVLTWGRHYALAPSLLPGGNAGSNGATANTVIEMLGPLHNYALIGIGIIGMVGLATCIFQDSDAENERLWPLLGLAFALIGLMGPWSIGPFRPDHAAIVFFLPIIFFATEAIWQLQRPLWIGLAVGLCILCGLVSTRTIIRPDSVLATETDVAAMHWIDEHIPTDAAFLIDVQPWLGLWRGADGGWWIMPLTGRRTALPPAAYGWGAPDAVYTINQRAQLIQNVEQDRSAAYCQRLTGLMQQLDVAYYYTHSERPLACGNLQALYQADGLYIYAQK
ncbi:MAG: hypothetical protein R3A44_11820 [Caldilineaceae bacterium]